MKLGSAAFALALTFGVTLAVVACGGADAEAAKQAAAKTEADEQEKFLDTYCAIILPCCNKVLSASLQDVAGCKTRLRALDPVTIANKQARTDCIAQAKVANPLPTFCPDFQHAKTPACPDGSRKKQVGLKKVGERCTIIDECAPSFDGIVDCRAGVCQLRKRGVEGDGPCDRTVDGDVVTATANEAQGGAVFDCYLKVDGLQCDQSQDPPKCAKPVVERDKCTDSVQCAKTMYCADTDNRCFIKLGKDQKCDVDSECKGMCSDKGFCTDAIAENGKCKVTANCVDGLECVTGVCTKTGPDARLAASCK